MTAAAEVLGVHRAVVDTSCRSCGTTITCGRRVALVAGTGAVHLRCLLVRQADDTPEENSAMTTQPPKPAPVDDDLELAVRKGFDR